MRKEKIDQCQLATLVSALLMGLWVGADDGVMSMIARGYYAGVGYSPDFGHSLVASIQRSVGWGLAFSLVVAAIYWWYDDIDGASIIGGVSAVLWGVGYGLSSVFIYGVVKGAIIGASSVFCLALLAIIIDLVLKAAMEKWQQYNSSIFID